MHNELKIERYLKYLESKKYSPNSIYSRKKLLNGFTRFLTSRNLKIEDVIEKDVFDYKSKQIKKNKPNTVQTYLSGVKAFYKWLFDTNQVFINPCENLVIECQDKSLPVVFTVKEINSIFDLLPVNTPTAKRNRAMLEISYSSLLRLKELVDIKLTDLDFHERTLRLIRKGNKEVIVPFGQYAHDAILDYLSSERYELLNGKESEYLWINQKSGEHISIRTVAKIMGQIREKTGFDFSIHTLRRTGATHLLQGGASLAIVKDMLSHSSYKTVCRYLRLNVKDFKETLAKSERLK